MKYRLVLFLSLTLVALTTIPSANFAKSAPQANTATALELRVLTLSGSPYERGVEHGRALKPEIHELVQLWKADLERQFKIKADTFIATFLKKTNFTSAIQKWTPDLLEEVRGIATGAGLDFETVFAFQLVDELWANGEAVAAEHCTSIGVNRRGDQPTLVAQNMDIPKFYHGYQTLLRIKQPHSGLEAFVLTAPGLIALNGMNSSAIGINCNTLLQLSNRREGLPVAFIVRGVLQQTSFDAAVQFLRKVPHASGQNYLVGGPERAASLECSAHKVTEYVPFPGADRTYHTNHPLVNDDFAPGYLKALENKSRTTLEGLYYCFRFEALEKRLRDRNRNVQVEQIKEALSSRDSQTAPISNPSTYASVMMVLSADPLLQLAPGKPHLTEFRSFRFSTPTPTLTGKAEISTTN